MMRERLHRLDGDRLREVERVEPRHAHQLRHAVDLGRARAALPRLAVPPHGQVAGLLGLDLVHGVEHDHALADLGRVVAKRALRLVAAPDAEGSLRHVFSLSLLAVSCSNAVRCWLCSLSTRLCIAPLAAQLRADQLSS